MTWHHKKKIEEKQIEISLVSLAYAEWLGNNNNDNNNNNNNNNNNKIIKYL